MAVSHVYPTIDFTLLDYAKIPVGAFLVGFDTSNGGKLCKLDRFGNITVIESGGIPITVKDEGFIVVSSAGSLNFTGSGVTATQVGLDTNIVIPGPLPFTGLNYQGLWNASTNSPTLTSSVGTAGDFYIVDVAGTTNLNGITDWQVTDWAIFEGGAWQKIDNHDPQAYTTVKDESTTLPQRTVLKFTGAGVSAADSGGETVVTISNTNLATGNTLTVDAVYGNDTAAAASPYSVPFLTISAALAATVAGNNVIVRAGVYNESISIPANVCLTGQSTQAVTLQRLGVTANTTLVTLNANSRLENFTCTLTSAGNYNLTGVEYVSGASITAKIRTCVINVTSTTVNAPTIIGALSAGTSATGYSATDAIARATVNVTSSSTGITRGVYVSGPNRFTVRETNIYARGTGSNIIGFETNDASAVAAIRASTVSGDLYDVNRNLGTMLIGATDLVNNTANGNSFTATQAPASFSLGVSGNLSNNYRYYMLTGTSQATQLTNEAKTNPYDPAKALPIPVTQLSLVIANTMAYSNTMPAGTAITLFIYKNISTTPEITLTMLPADGGLKRLDTQSFSLNPLDVIRVTMETTNNLGAAGNFQAVIGYY